MLDKPQIINWFQSNGVGLGISVPMPLIDRLCRKALRTDDTLFAFLSQAFVPYAKNLFILIFRDWDDLFQSYRNYAYRSLKS